jgi:hypothetical protein
VRKEPWLAPYPDWHGQQAAIDFAFDDQAIDEIFRVGGAGEFVDFCFSLNKVLVYGHAHGCPRLFYKTACLQASSWGNN